jgi:cell division septum initiation protein DivIVA
MLTEASAEAQSESEKTITTARGESEKLLAKAQADSEKIVARAKEESEKILSEARSASEATLGAAQTDVTEIVGMARQEAQSIISAAQTRAASTESNARLQAEFFIRQTTQSVADGIRASVLEICNNLLPTVAGHQYSEEEFSKSAPEALGNDDSETLSDENTPMLGGGNSAENGNSPESGVAPKANKGRAPRKSLSS